MVAEVVKVAKQEIREEEDDDDGRHTRKSVSHDAVADIVTIKAELPDDEDDEIASADARRERARQQYLKKKTEEEEAMPLEEQENAEGEEVIYFCLSPFFSCPFLSIRIFTELIGRGRI